MFNIKETRNFGKQSSSSSFLPSLPSTIPLSLPPSLPSILLPPSLPPFVPAFLPSILLPFLSLSQSISLFTLFLGLASVAVQTVLCRAHSCYWTRWKNDWDRELNYYVPGRYRMVGIASKHHNHFE